MAFPCSAVCVAACVSFGAASVYLAASSYWLVFVCLEHCHLYPFLAERLSSVYPPSEDTFLFLDALEKQESFLRKLDPTLIVEVGYATRLLLTNH